VHLNASFRAPSAVLQHLQLAHLAALPQARTNRRTSSGLLSSSRGALGGGAPHRSMFAATVQRLVEGATAEALRSTANRSIIETDRGDVANASSRHWHAEGNSSSASPHVSRRGGLAGTQQSHPAAAAAAAAAAVHNLSSSPRSEQGRSLTEEKAKQKSEVTKGALSEASAAVQPPRHIAELLDCLARHGWSADSCNLHEVFSNLPDRRHSKKLEEAFLGALKEARSRDEARAQDTEEWSKKAGLEGPGTEQRAEQINKLKQEASEMKVPAEIERLQQECQEAAKGAEHPDQSSEAYAGCLALVHTFMLSTDKQQKSSAQANDIWGRTAANMTGKLAQLEDDNLPLQAALANHSFVTDVLQAMADEAQDEVRKIPDVQSIGFAEGAGKA